MATQTDKLLLYGNTDLTTKVLNADGSGYDGEATIWSGLVNASITFTQSIQKWSADNNPNYKSRKGMPSGSGTITLRGINYSDYQKILAVLYSATDGIDFGASEDVKYFSLALTEEVDDKSRNRHILFKVAVDGIPPLDTRTVAEDDFGQRDIPLAIIVDPLFKVGDNTQWKFYRVLNSVEHSANFTANEKDITYPF